MRLGKIGAIVAVPLLSTTLLAGCASGFHFKISTHGQTATCSVGTGGGNCSANGQAVTVAPGDNGHHASGPATQRSEVPTRQSPTPQVQATASATDSLTPQQDVWNCMNEFPTSTKDTLVSFSTSSDARQNMATCLQIPPQTMALFLQLLFKYAYNAYIHGQFNSTQGQTQFMSDTSGQTLPSAVQQCRDQA